MMWKRRAQETSQEGFSAVEMILAVALFVFLSLNLYTGYSRILEAIEYERYRSTAAQAANEQFELARNLSYQDVGIQGGLPAGKLKATQTLVRNSMTLIATTTVRSIDDPFDGQVGSTTNDLSPADYKLVEVLITCISCKRSIPISFTSTVAPKGLETSGNNGALFVRVFDASGQPIQGADVHIVNASSSLTIDDVTNAQGMLQIVDAPPGVNAYDVSVSKLGYSLDRTYQLGSSSNPNPLKPHATVATQTITSLSFAIDQLSQLTVTSYTDTCTPVGNYNFQFRGTKLIGAAPDVFKYGTTSHTTNGSGLLDIYSLEWDNYILTPNDISYDLAGTVPLSPFAINPNTTQNIFLTVAPTTGNSLLVTVKDAGTGNTITDATTTISLGAFSATKMTGRGTQTQTDWSGGGGQMSYSNNTQYFDQDGNIDTTNFPGELKLLDVFGAYAASGYLTSSTFNTGASSNFRQLFWQPGSQSASTSLRFHIATANTDNASTTWNFLGPDGTGSTYYSLSGEDISATHNGDQFLRYRVYLDTASTTLTPIVSDVSFTSTSACIPAGQVLFGGLAPGTYDVLVEKAGYIPYNTTTVVGGGWQEIIIPMTP